MYFALLLTGTNAMRRFTSIFARALPTEFMVRVWDILLCEGE